MIGPPAMVVGFVAQPGFNPPCWIWLAMEICKPVLTAGYLIPGGLTATKDPKGLRWIFAYLAFKPRGLTELKTPGVYVESSPTWHSNPGGLTTNKTSGGMRCIFTCLAFKPRGSHRNQRPPGFMLNRHLPGIQTPGSDHKLDPGVLFILYLPGFQIPGSHHNQYPRGLH